MIIIMKDRYKRAELTNLLSDLLLRVPAPTLFCETLKKEIRAYRSLAPSLYHLIFNFETRRTAIFRKKRQRSYVRRVPEESEMIRGR